jgi:hypothetical protein
VKLLEWLMERLTLLLRAAATAAAVSLGASDHPSRVAAGEAAAAVSLRLTKSFLEKRR